MTRQCLIWRMAPVTQTGKDVPVFSGLSWTVPLDTYRLFKVFLVQIILFSSTPSSLSDGNASCSSLVQISLPSTTGKEPRSCWYRPTRLLQSDDTNQRWSGFHHQSSSLAASQGQQASCHRWHNGNHWMVCPQYVRPIYWIASVYCEVVQILQVACGICRCLRFDL